MQNSPIQSLGKIVNSNYFTNILSLMALCASLYVLYRTEFNRGKIVVSPPSRVAIASAEQAKIQGNDSDKLLLSFSIHNTGSHLKTVEGMQLSISDSKDQKIEFFAEAQFDQLKDIRINELQLQTNDNYSLITTLSIPSRTHQVVNYLFFYRCDKGWYSEEELEFLNCSNKPDLLSFEPGIEYKARLEVSTFEAESYETCFEFVLPGEPQSTVLDFSPTYSAISCRSNSM